MKSRKFVLAALTVLLTAVLVYFEVLSEDVYKTVVPTVVLAYIAGNVSQKTLVKKE